MLRQVKEYFALLGWRVTRNQQGMGCERGISDLTICCKPRGVTLAVETKSTTGRPTPEQVRYLDGIRNCGGEAIVAHSLRECHEQLLRICDRRDDIRRPPVELTGR